MRIVLSDYFSTVTTQRFLMTDEKQATRTCGQCHREIAEANFALHETHCSRFLCLCPDCDEAVPRERLKQHGEEQHSQVKCSKCNQKMERRYLKDHESDECEERLQICHFCKLELPWKELGEHLIVCGSRTELCRDCGRYVLLREQLEHGLTCSAADSVSGPAPMTSKPALNNNNSKLRVSCDRCQASFPAEDIDEHELWCVPAATDDEEDEQEEKEREDEGDISRKGDIPRLSSTFKATSLSDRPSRVPWGDGGEADEISTCPHCHLALPILTLLWHEKKCLIHIVMK